MGSVTDLADALLKGIGDNSGAQAPSQYLNTGFPPLNKILSGRFDGGLAFGRMYEMFGESSTGKTALATAWMVEAQKLGGVAGFIDWERSFNVDLAKNFGLNDERPYWIYAKPKTWEEGNMIAAKACKLIRESKAIPADAPILFVFDSIAAALPKSMADKEIDEYSMNDTTALARVTSTTLKAQASFCEEFNAIFLYLNQMRLKPGIVYGDPRCLRGDTMIPFVDGTAAAIEDIVKERISKQVWSYNEATGQIEPRAITGWHDNGSIKGTGKQFLHIRAKTPETANGVSAITVTNDHKVLVSGKGWVNAEEVKVGDKMLTRANESVTVEAEVTEVREAGKKLLTRMYDITVEGNHNFLAGNALNGVVVHNCTPGGKAMEFYASGRLALGRQKLMDTVDGEKQFVGQQISIQCVKSKFTKPFQETSLRMVFDEMGVANFDMVVSLLEFLIDKGHVEYSKPRVTWTDGKKYFVKELAKKLNEEPDGLDQLKALLPK